MRHCNRGAEEFLRDKPGGDQNHQRNVGVQGCGFDVDDGVGQVSVFPSAEESEWPAVKTFAKNIRISLSHVDAEEHARDANQQDASREMKLEQRRVQLWHPLQSSFEKVRCCNQDREVGKDVQNQAIVKDAT